MRVAWVALAAVSLAPVASPVMAQRESDRAVGDPTGVEGVYFRFGGGFARGSLDVARTTGTNVGFVLAAEVAGVRGRWRTWSVDVQLEPFTVPNLVRAEHYRAFTLLVSRYFFGPLGVGVGFQSRFWGGFDPYVSSDWGPALGLTLTTPTVEYGNWLVSSDVAWRGSGGEEITTGLLALRLFLGRRRAS